MPHCRDGSVFNRINVAGEVTFTFDNSWVVPYNAYLSEKYRAHINVEVCSSFSAVKYLYKYVYKGHDRALVRVQRVDVAQEGGGGGGGAAPRDELQEYVDGRYVSASEACSRIFSFPMHKELPNVVCLPVHCEGEQVVYFEEGEEMQLLSWPGAQSWRLGLPSIKRPRSLTRPTCCCTMCLVGMQSPWSHVV